MDRDAVDMILEQWNKERPDVDVSSMGVLGRLNRASRLASLDVQKFMNQFGLEPWEFDVLATLRRSAAEAPLTPGRLASLTMIGSAAMTNRVDRLVSRGLVHRETNPENRRQLLISLTPEGLALVDDVVEHHVENQQKMLEGLSKTEQTQLANLLRKFLLTNNDGEPS
ncbi:DNA-binding MarR family transcriptional regulator [Paenarthrobacter nitroguajacolicus]|uniref:MarR family winged helix-turn-helix transcriptional regulator n=1 Tax=Paenarthrobacter nitroguajacolicus TaxID=211146 RepID=UPI00285A63B8|nr:MarR family transcriptional regulator [Paenarthrobacter nitroguajacolicus]MDR6986008.1 DNA-binding MarR family transcriptional regulator [Paenarthrobacter nitroguajacolicus]